MRVFTLEAKVPRKPQGFNAITKITAVDGGPALLELIRLQMPNQKEAAEQFIMDMFAASLPNLPAGTAPLTLLGYKKNNENDVDFRVTTPDGNFEMELTEFAPLAALRSHGFDRAPNTFKVGELADLLYDCIDAKNKYAKGGMKKMLLVYVVHFAFLPSEDVLTLVRSKLAAVRHQFEQIVFFAPVERDFGIVLPLYPAVLTRVSAAQRQRIRENTIGNADPRSMIPIPGGAIFPPLKT